MPDIQLDVVLAGTGPTRQITPNMTCRLCPDPIRPEHAVIRVEDFTAGPGVHQWAMHKTCVQLLLDCTIDDAEIARSKFERYRDELIERGHPAICNN